PLHAPADVDRAAMLRAAPECARELVGEQPGDDERGRRHRGFARFPHDADHVADADTRDLHQRHAAVRPREWIDCNTPIASRFATIDEPPTVTNGSGMPVTGATPIVMPTLTKTWNRKPNTMPPATVALKRSSASVMIRRPRQTTRRYSSSRIETPRNPRCSANEAKTKSVACSGR